MIVEFKKDELVRGSFILLVMLGIYNFTNYLFHFSTARLLTPAEYGVLAVLMSFIYIFGIPSESIQTMITKYTSKYQIKKEDGKVGTLLEYSLRKFMFFATITFIIFFIACFFFAYILKIEFWLLIVTGLIIFTVFSLPIIRGILQGSKKFYQLGINMIIESVLKLILAIGLILIGWKVYGAVVAILIGFVIAFFMGFISLKDILKSKKEKIDTREMYSYGKPIFISRISLVLLYSLDIILAKAFFSPDLAGKYAVASMLGKIIFFGTQAVSKTMFPLTSESHETGKDTSKLLKKSLMIVAFLALFILLIYLIFPNLIITLLFGEKYVEVAGILFIIGLSFTFISLTNLTILYALSTNRIRKSSLLLLFFVGLQILLLYFFHNSLREFALLFLFSNIIIFLYSLILVKK